MTFTVAPIPEVVQALAEEWVAGDKTRREALTRASHRVDADLRRKPLGFGVPLNDAGTLREWRFSIPGQSVRVVYEVFTEDRRVDVTCLNLL